MQSLKRTTSVIVAILGGVLLEGCVGLQGTTAPGVSSPSIPVESNTDKSAPIDPVDLGILGIVNVTVEAAAVGTERYSVLVGDIVHKVPVGEVPEGALGVTFYKPDPEGAQDTFQVCPKSEATIATYYLESLDSTRIQATLDGAGFTKIVPHWSGDLTPHHFFFPATTSSTWTCAVSGDYVLISSTGWSTKKKLVQSLVDAPVSRPSSDLAPITLTTSVKDLDGNPVSKLSPAHFVFEQGNINYLESVAETSPGQYLLKAYIRAQATGVGQQVSIAIKNQAGKTRVFF